MLNGSETTLWKVVPSFLIYTGRIGLILGLAIVYWRYLSDMATAYFEYADYLVIGIVITLLLIIIIVNLSTIYILTSERIIFKEGVLVQKRNEIEHYRILDFELISPILLRIFNVSFLRIVSTDPSHPNKLLKGLPHGDQKLDQLRKLVEETRRRKGVRVIE